MPDGNIFMLCKVLDPGALTPLPPGFTVRSCRPDELDVWKAFPFDDPQTAAGHADFMDNFFRATYGGKEAEFFSGTLFVCDPDDRPVATCLLWKAYGRFSAIHWFKVRKEWEGRGIGRALLSIVMRSLAPADFPVYLHTQPGSYRAIKLYTDFGFALLTDERIGRHTNDLARSLPYLQRYLPPSDFARLRFASAPPDFLEALRRSATDELQLRHPLIIRQETDRDHPAISEFITAASYGEPLTDRYKIALPFAVPRENCLAAEPVPDS